jgi:rubrerythrin
MMPVERRRVQDDVAAARARAIAAGSWPLALPMARRTPGEARGIVRGPHAAPVLSSCRCERCGAPWAETSSFAGEPCPFCGAPR